jgi:predicted DNA-binding transcriptional regulator AlpA
MAAGKFPLAVRVGRRALYWKSEDLQSWERKLSKIDLQTNQREKSEEIKV